MHHGYLAVASKRDQGEYAERFLIWLRRLGPVACDGGTDLEGLIHEYSAAA